MADNFAVFKQAPLFIINLQRRSDRRANVLAEVEKLHAITVAPTWVIAIDGKELIDLQNDPDLSHRAKSDLQKKKTTHEGIYTPGAVACYKSHRKIWKHIIDNKIPFAKVFEDDFRSRQHVAKRLHKTLQHLPDGWGYIALSDLLLPSLVQTKPRAADGSGRKPYHGSFAEVHGFMLTTGYYLTYECAKTLYAASIPIEVQVDAFISLMATERRIRAFRMIDPLLYQPLDPNSDIQTACFKCLMPSEPEFYVGAVCIAIGVLVLLLIFISAFVKCRNKSSKPGVLCDTSMCKLFVGPARAPQ